MEKDFESCRSRLDGLNAFENDIAAAGDPVVARQALQAEVDQLNLDCSRNKQYMDLASSMSSDGVIIAKPIGSPSDPDLVDLDVKPLLSPVERRTCDALKDAIQKCDGEAFKKAFADANLNSEGWKAIEENLRDEIQKSNPLLVVRSVEDTANGNVYLVVEERQPQISRSVNPDFGGSHYVDMRPVSDPAEIAEGASVLYGGQRSSYLWNASETTPPREVASYGANLPEGWLQSRSKN